jgi:hypothetical protein
MSQSAHQSQSTRPSQPKTVPKKVYREGDVDSDGQCIVADIEEEVNEDPNPDFTITAPPQGLLEKERQNTEVKRSG